nr:protein SZT2 [Hymenolepis microstoma]
MASEVDTESVILADAVYILTTQSHKVSHNTRVEWFIGNVNRNFIFPSADVTAEFPDWPIHSSSADWSSLSIIAASPAPQKDALNFPLVYKIQPTTTVKYLAHSYRITFVLDLSDSMLQPTPSGLSVLHHAVAAIETTLYKLMPPNSSLPLPLSVSHLTPFSIFISIIGVVPNRRSFTLIHDWEGSYNEIKTIITTVAQRLFQLETDNLITSQEGSSGDSALVDLLRHGVLNLAMQMPDWAPASLIIVSDACFTTLDMAELDRSLAHLRASSIRCSFIIPSAYYEKTDLSFSPNGSLRNLLRLISSSPCIPHVDLCQFIAHATAGFCLTEHSPEWEMLMNQNCAQWNQIHELLLALRLQDDMTSTPEKEGELGWLPIYEIQPYYRVVNAALNHVLASRLKDGYRLRGVSIPPSDKTNQNLFNSSYIQIELALAWKPGVVFRLFLAGEWYLPTGQLPISSSPDYLPKYKFRKPSFGHYCIANLRVRANCSLLRVFGEQRRDQVTSPYLASVLERFDFHFRLLRHVDNYLETVSSFNLNADIYTVPVRYLNGLCSVFITAQNASGGSEIYLSGNTAEEMERDKSLTKFVHYWGQLLSLDIANCYRWMHSETIYVVLEHDSPLPTNLFIPLQTRRITETLTCRQSLARIHSMLNEWSTFVLLENHTYIRLEYPKTERINTPCKRIDTDLGLHHSTSQYIPQYFTLVRLEMKLPEVRVRVAFTAGVQYEYRRATIDQLSRQFKFLSFLPRGRQAVPKSRHKSGTPAPLHPPTESIHVPPLQRSWGETPCCLVFESQLDRLIVETGTWATTRPQNYLNTSLSPASNFQTSKSFMKGTVIEARCEVAPSLLRQHLCHSSCIWVIPLVSKSPFCVAKMFSTLNNLRIQEGFHFVRSGPQPGFVSLAREVMFSVDSAAEGAVKQPCLIQYQLYPFRHKSNWKNLSKEDDDETIKIASDAVQKVLDLKLDGCIPKMLIDRLKALTSAQLSSEVHVATEVWIEPKHGHATDLPTEALYMANLPYDEVVQRIMQLDCFCLAAYITLEKMLTACLLKMIELQRLASPTSVAVQFATPPTSGSSPSSPATDVPFNLAAVTSVSPRMCLICPLLLDASLLSNGTDIGSYPFSENVINRLVFNLPRRTPYITAIPLSNADCDQFSQFLISQEREEIRPTLRRALAESGAVKWQCFATITSLIDSISRNGGSKPGSKDENRNIHGLPHLENLAEASSIEITSSPVAFFVLPSNIKCATSSFCQHLMNNLRQRLNGSSRLEASFPIFLFSCTHTYLSFPLDDRWTYSYPETLVIDFFRQEAGLQIEGEHNTRLIRRDDLTANPPQSFLSSAKGNPQLTKELILLWARLRDASLGLLNLCNEAFVECAHGTLLQGFMVSEAALRNVLMSEQFCSSLTPISIDATDFLFSTCSHCFKVIRNTRNCTDSGASDTSKSENKGSPGVCEIRPHDTDRIRNRLSSVFSQYFSPIPQFSGFYYFKGAGEAYKGFHGQKIPPVHCCDTWPIPIAKTSTLEVPVHNPIIDHHRSAEMCGSRQVMFCTSSRSGSDTEEGKRRHNSGVSCHRMDILGPVEPEQIEKLEVIYRRPLFMKVMVKLKWGDEEEIILPIESLPICLPNVIPNCGQISRENVRLSVVFTPLLWKPEVGTSYSEAIVESPDHQEIQPPVHLDRLEERNESLHNSDSSDNEEISIYSGVVDANFNLIRPLPSPQISTSRRNIPVSSNANEEYDALVPFHWCECQLEVSENDTPCCICRTTCSAEFIHYLDNEQWTSIQQTVQVFRWLLQDEVVCSQRLIQPLSVSTVEAVLQHMETTKCLLLNSYPGTSAHSPFHISHSHARFSKSCTTVMEKGACLGVSDILQNLMSAIAWETVDLEFISQSEKSIPRFLQRLQSMSFRYAQAGLVDTGDYYVVCRAEPIPPPSSASKDIEHREVPERHEVSASPTVRTRRYGVVKETDKVSAHSIPSTTGLQLVKEVEDISEESGEFESVTSRTRRSSLKSLEHQQNLPASTTTTEGEFDDARFLLSSHFPPHDALETSINLRQSEGPSLPAYWLIFRVGNGSIQAFFHHSDSHRATSTVVDSCPHCIVFRRALGDIESIVRLVNQSLLLDQLLLDRVCHPALLPEPEELPRHPPRYLQASLSSSRKRSSHHLTHSPSLAVSASSATDSEATDGQSVDNSSRKKSSSASDPTVLPIDHFPPGSLACPSKFTFCLEVSPRAVVAGDRGNQVLPELRRHLENFAVLNRKNVFVFDYVDPNSSDSLRLPLKKNLIPRIFYIILSELSAFETLGHRSGHSERKESLPLPITANKIQLQVTLHGISSPSRQFCTFVKSLLQSLLDKIILEYLQQALSRTVLFRFASYDFDFLFIRRTHVTRHQLCFTLPEFLLNGLIIPHIPKGSLVLPFCHYLKQNLLICMTAAKPEKEVLPLLRSRFGCGEVMLYHRTAKFGLVTALVDLLQGDKHEPYCITSCLDLQEWLHRKRIGEDLYPLVSVGEMTEFLKDIELSQHAFPESPDRLLVRLRLWVREEVDIKLLNRKLFLAIQNALYDLLMEYLVLSLPACIIEVPVLKNRFSEPTPNSVTKSGAHPFNNDFIRLPTFVSQSLLPWFEVATSLQLPLVIERRFQLASLQSVELLVGELVTHLNSLVESRVGLPSNHLKCPIHSTKPGDGRNRSTNSQSQQGSSSITCSCQQCINFFAFVAGKSEWMNFSKARSFSQKGVSFGQQREFLIVGKNYANCRYQSALNRSPSGGVNLSATSTNEEDQHVHVKYVASWSVLSPLQRHQSLAIKVQQVPDETTLDSFAVSDETSIDQTSSPIVSPNTPMDIPEFCKMQLRLPKFLFHQQKSLSVTSIRESTDDRSRQQCQPTICLQVPRQTLCVIHFQEREVRVNLYNWSRDDADRLLHRIETLILWYNQRYQLLGCLSLQKTGLFHCLRTPSHLQLLKQANQFSNRLAPPELTPSVSSTPASIQTVPVTASTSSMSIRRKFLEGLVGSGAAPLQQQPPSEAPNTTPMSTQNAITSSAMLSSPATPIGEGTIPSVQHVISPPQQEHLRVVGGNSKELRDFNLTRIYQNCARVPALGTTASSNPPAEFLDVVHLHVDQALRVMKNDRTHAEELRLITAPLKVWMAGDVFDVDSYNSSIQAVDSPKTQPTPATTFYTAVKRYSRTLHTVCSPILFCPCARLDTLKLRELEEVSEEEQHKRLTRHMDSEQKDISGEESGYSNLSFTRNENRSGRIEEQQQISTRLRTLSKISSSATSREIPPWMQEATDCLLQEFITYMTKQMQFSVIYSTLDSDVNKLEQPYALLQRSVKMAGVHLIEVFIRDCLFCVRLKAIELCRLTRAATRAILTGPLAADLFGRAAAVAAVKITSGIVDPPIINPSSSSSTSSPVVSRSPCIVKWEESSRLCDCIHLHSFLYDFYLRNVDSFLKLQSDLIGQRMQVPTLAWALPQTSKITTRRSTLSSGGTGGSFSVARHPFLPANYPIVAFLRDLSQIIPQPPVFARGALTHIPMCLTSDTRIKPEQIFEHLIDSRQIYGFKAFDLGISSSLPTHARFGFCAFTSPKSSTSTEEDRQTSQQKHQLGMNHRHSGCDMEEEDNLGSPPETSSHFSPESQTATSAHTADKTDLMEEKDMSTTADDRASTEMSSPPILTIQHKQSAVAQAVDQLRLPSLKHFALACAAFLDMEAPAAKKSMTSTASQDGGRGEGAGGEVASSNIVISVFVILTDQYRRFPRPRLSSLQYGTDDYHSPVQWPAIRPGFSSDKDMNIHSPKLVRSGSHETTQAEPSLGFIVPMTTGQRCRHTSLNIRGLGDTTTTMTTADRSSSNEGVILQRHPGLRYKFSYLGVLPSHQMELHHSLKSVHQALCTCMPRIINSAILSCHKNLLWYRLFDSQYFPSTQPSDYQEGVEEIGQEAVSLLGPEVIHRGLSCDEFEDLINSAPLKLDVLKMDPRLVELLKISGKHLAISVVNHLNGSGGKTVAFVFSETPNVWTHLVVIDPTFREGLIQISWRRGNNGASKSQILTPPQPTEVRSIQLPSVKSRLSSMLRNILSSVNRTVEGVPMEERPEEFEESWDSYEFTMMAVFRSMGSMEASMRNFSNPSTTPLPSSNAPPPPSNLSVASNIYRTHLMPALKLLIEILTLHVWNDLH